MDTKTYRLRIADKLLAEKLDAMGAVLIEGAKWCGKTTTAEQAAKSVLYLADTDTLRQNMEMIDLHPRVLLSGAPPMLIDEWQEAPKLWDAVRFEVDHRGKEGQFILTGSAAPDKRRDPPYRNGTVLVVEDASDEPVRVRGVRGHGQPYRTVWREYGFCRESPWP